MKNVKSSSLPAIISSARMILEKSEKIEKFAAGPIMPNPGPTFPRHVSTDESVVTRSKPLMDIRSMLTATTSIEKKMKFAIFVMTS